MAANFSDPVLPDLVEKSLVADLEQGRSLFAIPVGLLQCLCNGCSLGLIFCATCERLQAPCPSVPGTGLRARISPQSTVYVVFRIKLCNRQAFISEDEIALYEVAQLSQVARPRVFKAGGHHRRRKRKGCPRVTF